MMRGEAVPPPDLVPPISSSRTDTATHAPSGR